MKTRNLRTNQGCEWYKDYLQALDAKDVDRYKMFLANECTLVMNNADPLLGNKAVLCGLSHYWRSFGEL